MGASFGSCDDAKIPARRCDGDKVGNAVKMWGLTPPSCRLPLPPLLAVPLAAGPAALPPEAPPARRRAWVLPMGAAAEVEGAVQRALALTPADEQHRALSINVYGSRQADSWPHQGTAASPTKQDRKPTNESGDARLQQLERILIPQLERI